MPLIKSGRVLVTGASGFLAVEIVQQLLDAGFTVRGTVRAASKGDYLVQLFNNPNFSYVIVEDSVASEAFTEAVRDCDGIMHTASPFHFNANHPDKLIKPAVEGTLNLLRAAHGSDTVKRVVVTSSIAAILEPTPTPVVFDETHWNEHSIREVHDKAEQATQSDMYRASKSMAEKAAWAFMREQHPLFDLACVNPSIIFGPPKQQITSPANLNTSTAMFYDFINGKTKSLSAPAGNYVDVRDVAMTHILALSIEEAGGERFLCNSDKGGFTWQEVADILHARLPEHDAVKKHVPMGERASASVQQMGFSNAKAKHLLKQTFTPFEDSVVDTFHALCELEKAW
ncbi:hypothetical protein E3P99_03387 [Wallemia hederae]|uniref:3-beta hydroxysteroid dehydrogenase/isomerase domain-containing protein n=1 Tax=Wallemia hederae TaxID=1540922 RepID=A0A4T0FI01_9BASI|nr:hypothetical protein E3P99_03387 [Wallemia hederae]